MRALRTGLLRAALGLLPAPLLLQPAALAAAPAQPRAANLLLFEVRLGGQMLSDSLTAYEIGRDVYLPLGELARLLTLAIRVGPEPGRASGYILAEERGFSLDVARQVLELGGRRETFDASLVDVQPEDIYVASRLLARWLPVDLEFDMSNLALHVKPREQLPLQARLARRQSGSLPGAPGGYADPGYPRLATPYRMADVPFVDQTLSLVTDKRGGRRRTDAAYTAYATTDLLGMEAALYLSRNRHDPASSLRLTLGRHDPDGNLLGPLRARSAAFGSVPVPGLANVSSSSATGNGVALSNRPLDQPSSFDRHTLQGALPPGWDVELYYNDALVGFQQSGPSGKYSFEDQPLAYGPNEFRLVFHGPLGQSRVERQSFLLEGSALPRGALHYDLAAHRDVAGQARAMAQFEWGMSEHLNLAAGWQRLPLFERTRSYANLGLRGYCRNVILTLDALRADDGGTLAQLGMKTRFKDVSLAASRARLNGFNSEFFVPTSDPVRTRDELRAEGVLHVGSAHVFPVSLQLRRDLLASGRAQREVHGRVSSYRGGTALTNALRWQSLAGIKRADGLLQASRQVAGVGLSGQLQYSVSPRASLDSAAVSADVALAQGYQLNLGVTRMFADRAWRTGAALNKSLGSYGLGVTAYYSDRRAYGLGLQFFMAIGVEPRRARLFTDAQPMAQMGAASIRVFLDKDLNGTMDGDDEPIGNAGFTVNGANVGLRTDAAGLAYLGRLPANRHTDIGVDPTTLEDPQWQARTAGARIVARPGKVSQVDFAVAVTGEVDGTTYLVAGGARRPVGDLKLELVDAAQRVVTSMTSAADGYYVMTGILPGDYQLRIEPAQLERLRLRDAGSQRITIGRDGTVLNGRDLEVREAGDGT